MYRLEDLVAELVRGKRGMRRAIYLTVKPMGKPGSRGQMQRGDLSRDAFAKIVCFDPDVQMFTVVRNNVPGEERVAPADIVTLMRSFVRQVPEQRAFYTVADSDPQTNQEKIVRSVSTLDLDLGGGGNAAHNRTTPPSSNMWVLGVIALVALGAFMYWRSKRNPPARLPPRQFLVAR